MRTEHILIIRFSTLGDVAMAVPVVHALARQYPAVRVTMLSQSKARPLFEGLAPNVSFMEADINGEYHGIKGLNSLYRRLAAKNFTAVADLNNSLKSSYLRMRFNIGQDRVAHVNKHRDDRRMLTAKKNKRMQPIAPMTDNYAETFARLGFPISDMSFTTMLTPVQANLRLLPKEIGEKKDFQQWVGIAPFAAREVKEYPLPMMETVIKGIIKRHPSARIFLFGGGDRETRLLSDLAKRHPKCTNVAGLLGDLREELILMSHLDVMVTMDSANMHLASLVNTPVVSVWGATHPYAGFMGWGQKMENAVQVDMPCRPCSIFGNKPCRRGNMACLGSIPPETIISKIEAVVSGKLS